MSESATEPADDAVEVIDDLEGFVFYEHSVDSLRESFLVNDPDQDIDPEELDLDDGGFGLWARYEHFETPVYERSPYGVWNSMEKSSGMFAGTEPSDSFYVAVAEQVRETEEAEWGHVPEEVFEQLSENEREVVLSLRAMVLSGGLSLEMVMLIEFAKEKSGLTTQDDDSNRSQE